MILNNNDEEMLLSIRLSSYKGTYLPFLLWMSPLGVLEPGIKIINPLENNPNTGQSPCRAPSRILSGTHHQKLKH